MRRVAVGLLVALALTPAAAATPLVLDPPDVPRRGVDLPTPPVPDAQVKAFRDETPDPPRFRPRGPSGDAAPAPADPDGRPDGPVPVDAPPIDARDLSLGAGDGDVSVATARPASPTPPEPGWPETWSLAVAGATAALAVAVWLLRRDVPDDPTRRHLLRLVRRRPGRHLSDLADDLDVDRTTVRHHVDVLADAGQVTCRTVGRCRRVYPADGDAAAELADVLDHPIRASILRALLRRSRVDQRSLRDDCDVAPSTMTYHARRLEDAGLIQRRRDGRRTVLELAERARERVRGALG